MDRKASFRIAALALTLLCGSTAAQETPTLHVYTDRVQIPVLVLGSHREDLPLLTPDQFLVTMDSLEMPKLHIRREGDDPLEVSLLVDSSDTSNELVPLLAKHIPSLMPRSITPQDHVSVFGMDGCALRQSRKMALAEEANLAAAVKEVASYPPYKRSKAPCDKPATLVDVLYYLTTSMRQLPGRRIVLAVTNGASGAAKHTPMDVRNAAIASGVTIFTLTEPGKEENAELLAGTLQLTGKDMPPLQFVSELSGGMLTETKPEDLSFALSRIFQRIRGRYILEFPRPQGMYGTHRLDVRLRNRKAFIRSGGTAFPSAMLRSQETIDPSQIPELSVPWTENAATDAPAATAEPVQPAEAPPVPAKEVSVKPAPTAVPVDPTDITGEVETGVPVPGTHQ